MDKPYSGTIKMKTVGCCRTASTVKILSRTATLVICITHMLSNSNKRVRKGIKIAHTHTEHNKGTEQYI